MKRAAGFLLCMVLSIYLAGCATPPPPPPPAAKPAPAQPKATAEFVLLADADGKVGKVKVGNQGGEKVLERERESVSVTEGMAPSEPRILSEDELKAKFGAALGALPASPAKFILYFQSASSALTPESERDIDKIVAAVNERVSPDVSIAGHADTVGSADVNVKLSLDRAKVVESLIKGKGVDTTSFQITSHGKNNPLVKTGDGVAEPRNRRVEVIVR